MARYIDADKAIEMIKNDLPNVVNYHRMDAIECLELIPTADVEEVRHGEWLEQNLCGKTIYVCSNCQTLGSPLWKRCPVCEVKMGGKNENL